MMTLEIGQTPASVFPGLTRRYPIRLMGHVRQLKDGRAYRVIVSMDIGNPAFEAVYHCRGHFWGWLCHPDHTGTQIEEMQHSIYAHIIEEIA